MTLKFAENTGMNLSGSNPYYNHSELWAIGANHPDSIITFTSLNGKPGGWNGISFGEETKDHKSFLKNCVIENAKDNNLYMYGTNQPSIDSCIIDEYFWKIAT